MEFNKNWTKEDNDKLRNFIKENKNIDFIRDYFGNEKLFYHPSKKYYIGKISTIPTIKNKIEDFTGFINEIKYEELKTDFIVNFEKSNHFRDKFNYNYVFQTNSGNRYVVDFIYLKDNIGPYMGRDIWNISFTLEGNRNVENHTNYEKQTFLNENNEIIKRVIYIFRDFVNKFGKDSIYLIGETEDKRKINWYRNIIKDSFDNIKETMGVSSYTGGLKAYYYEIISLSN
jgi:hypothetical protein